MARPKKERVICSAPRYRSFTPVVEENGETVLLESDEYEVLRLHDLEHLSQAEVANQMLVSRTTVTQLLSNAHQKLADALVNGKPLTIINNNCCVCEIGAVCPPEKKRSCNKKEHCAASCRYASEGCNKS